MNTHYLLDEAREHAVAQDETVDFEIGEVDD